MYRWLSVLVAINLMTAAIHADENASDQMQKIKAKLTESFPTHIPDRISRSPVDGLYQAVYGTQIIYVTEDARYVFHGVIMDLEDGNKNLTEQATGEARKAFMSTVNAQQSISFGADKPKHTITVFTDIDCGYCRKLHNEMDQYASYGIKINYLMFPRNGLQSPSYTKSVSVWCSDDREDALTRAKNGESIPSTECENPVANHFDVGQKLGVTGTPAIVTANGDLMPGYVPAKQLAQRLDQLAQ